MLISSRSHSFQSWLLEVKSESLLGQTIAHGNVTLLVDNDWSSFRPFWAVVLDPNSCGPFTDVVSARKYAWSLDVSDLYDVFVLWENVAKLLARCAMTHGAVDVFQDLCGVSRAVSQKFLDFFSYAYSFHCFVLLWFRYSLLGDVAVTKERGHSYNRSSNNARVCYRSWLGQVYFLHGMPTSVSDFSRLQWKSVTKCK